VQALSDGGLKLDTVVGIGVDVAEEQSSASSLGTEIDLTREGARPRVGGSEE